MAPQSKAGRAPSMSDVAQRAGVSHQTVSRVLHDHPHVRPETREAVRTAIAALGYRPNVAARALATNRPRTVGLLAAGSSLHGPVATLSSLEEAARELGYHVTVATVRQLDGESIDRVFGHVLEQATAGVVAVVPTTQVAAMLGSTSTPVPLVVVSSSPAHLVPGAARVAIEQEAGVESAVEHLVGLGHRRIAHLAGPEQWFDAARRLVGWRSALHGRGLSDRWLYRGDWSPASGYAAGLALVADVASGDGPTAVVVANDHMALGLLRACAESGVGVPADLSVVGFDDITGADQFIPPLTTVRQPFDRLGREALAALLRIADGASAPGESTAGGLPSEVSIPTEFVVRASTARPAGTAPREPVKK